jgi:hypothetical protein
MGPDRFCFDCKRNYCVINCRKCEQSLYLERIEKSVGVIDFCPHCKTVMQYYHCGTCNSFNEKDPACINPQCPPSKSIIDNTIKKTKSP